jgi:hypothetical protein
VSEFLDTINEKRFIIPIPVPIEDDYFKQVLPQKKTVGARTYQDALREKFVWRSYESRSDHLYCKYLPYIFIRQLKFFFQWDF